MYIFLLFFDVNYLHLACLFDGTNRETESNLLSTNGCVLIGRKFVSALLANMNCQWGVVCIPCTSMCVCLHSRSRNSKCVWAAFSKWDACLSMILSIFFIIVSLFELLSLSGSGNSCSIPAWRGFWTTGKPDNDSPIVRASIQAGVNFTRACCCCTHRGRSLLPLLGCQI